MTEPYLKPCPFCGSKPHIEPWHGGAATKVMISCDGESCTVEPSITGETPEEAAAFWNTREQAMSLILDRKLANYGQAYDSPDTYRAYTYADQPSNNVAYRLGRVSLDHNQAGDMIDRGLYLLKALHEIGFGVFEIGDPEALSSAKRG